MNQKNVRWIEVNLKRAIFAMTLIICFAFITAYTYAADEYVAKAEDGQNIIEYDRNDGSTVEMHEHIFKVGDETVYCTDIKKTFEAGNKTRNDALASMSADQIASIALSLEYIKQYAATHTELSSKAYWLEQSMVWQLLSEQLGWDCQNVRIQGVSQSVQDEIYSSARAFAEANKGKYKCGGYIYTGEGQDLGQFWANQRNEVIVRTTATNEKTGEKNVVSGKTIKIVDKVELEGLEVGTKYKLSGWQMVKEDNQELLINGNKVSSEYEFTADSEKMTVEIPFTFDGSALGGKNVVAFEELYDISNPKEAVKIAEHKDIDDSGQTVLIKERVIKIYTTAAGKNGKKEMKAGKKLTIVDKVELEGLEVGTKYKLFGWQMVKENNQELIINGNKVSGEYEFTADSEKMTVEIPFTFDGSALGGKNLVTFEELYDMTNSSQPKKMAEHKNISDEGQTVAIKNAEKNGSEKIVETGDSNNIFLFACLSIMAMMALAMIAIFRKRNNSK